MSNTTNSVSNSFVNYFFTDNGAKEKKNEESLLERIETAILVPITFIKEEWTTIKETSKAVRRVLRIVIVSCAEISPKVTKVIAGLGLLMGIEALFTLSHYPQTISRFLKNIEFKDIEGVILSAFSLVAVPGDALDSFITYVSSLTELGIIPTITFLSVIAQPLALSLLTYSSLKGIYDIIRLTIHFVHTPQKITQENLNALRESLKEKLNGTEEEKNKIKTEYSQKTTKTLKEKNAHILTRQTDKKIVAIMKNLLIHLEKNHEDVDTANKALADMRTLMRRKIVVGTLNTLATIAMETALIASLVFQISPVVIPAIALGRGAIITGKHYYERYGFDQNLNLPDWIAVME